MLTGLDGQSFMAGFLLASFAFIVSIVFNIYDGAKKDNQAKNDKDKEVKHE